MPNQPATPNHSVRVPDERWKPAEAKAADNGMNMSELINMLLEEYGRDYRDRGY